MGASTNGTLMGAEDPPPAISDNPSGRSPFLLVGDHAGNAIPHSLCGLGLGDADRHRHIAWDIGVAALGQSLAKALDAVFLRQHYSRLVIDCNRDPASAEAVPEASDGSIVPGNRGLDRAHLDQRVNFIHSPYHAIIAAEIGRRAEAGRPTIIVSLHSFTPRMGEVARPWDIGVLHDLGDTAFAMALLSELQRVPGLVIGDNEPYRMDGTDYTVPRHAFPARLPYAEIEVRQDHLATGEGIGRWSEIIGSALEAALLATADRG